MMTEQEQFLRKLQRECEPLIGLFSVQAECVVPLQVFELIQVNITRILDIYRHADDAQKTELDSQVAELRAKIASTLLGEKRWYRHSPLEDLLIVLQDADSTAVKNVFSALVADLILME